MKAKYTILNPSQTLRSRLFDSVTFSARGWVSAAATLTIGVPLALMFAFYAFDHADDDNYAISGDTTPEMRAELALPDLPDAPEDDVAFNEETPLVPPTAEKETADVEVPDEEQDPSRRVMTLQWGDTLFDVLSKLAIPSAEAHEAMSALSKVYNPRQIKAGEEVTVVFDEGVFSGFEFDPEADRSVRVERNDNGFKAATVVRPLSNDIMAASVRIDSSFYEAGIRAGIPVSTMSGLVKALSYTVDFQRDIRSGDTFRVLYEVRRNPEGVLVRTGKILFAEISTKGKTIPVYLYRFKDGSEAYYSAEGKSLRRTLLRTPVNAVRISSGFGMREHPILGYTKMHRGVDFAAPTGTKIYASGDGEIVERGWKGGYGNYIRIRHSSTISTAYGHMSRFESGLSVHSRVRQGDIIGYVGTTGRSTGPHLHYEVLVNGTQVNPLRVANLSTNDDSLKGQDLTQFKGMVKAIDQQFKKVETGQAIQVSFRSP